MDASTEDPKPEPPIGPRKHPRIRRAAWVGIPLLALLLVGASTWALLRPAAAAGPDAFRFEEVYVGTKNETGPATVDLTLWFTNQDEADLPNVRIVAVGIDHQRGVMVSRSEVALDVLAGRHTEERVLHLDLNISRQIRIDLLVLVDGLLVARGHGSAGPADANYDALRTAAGTRFVMTHDFEYVYGEGED